MGKKIQMLFAEDIRKLNIKPLSDKELTQLLHLAKYSENPEEKKRARQKIILHILPVIISKCKLYFKEDFVVENTDFINEVILYLLEKGIDNYRLEEQEGDRCALFFALVNFAVLLAYRKLKKKHFDNPDIKLPIFLNTLAKEFQDTHFLEQSIINYYNKSYLENKKSRKKQYLNEYDDNLEDEYYTNEIDDEPDDTIFFQDNFIAGEKSFIQKENIKDFYRNILPKFSLLTNILYFLERPFPNSSSFLPPFYSQYKKLSLLSYSNIKKLQQNFDNTSQISNNQEPPLF